MCFMCLMPGPTTHNLCSKSYWFAYLCLKSIPHYLKCNTRRVREELIAVLVDVFGLALTSGYNWLGRWVWCACGGAWFPAKLQLLQNTVLYLRLRASGSFFTLVGDHFGRRDVTVLVF
jgi:hypothetical protein